MTRDDQQRLLDILECKKDLEQIAEMSFDEFSSNKLAQRAAERLLEVIGEAANSLGHDFKNQHQEIDWRRVIALRHLLAHHYHRVDPHQIWVVLTEQIPELVQVICDETK